MLALMVAAMGCSTPMCVSSPSCMWLLGVCSYGLVSSMRACLRNCCLLACLVLFDLTQYFQSACILPHFSQKNVSHVKHFIQ